MESTNRFTGHEYAECSIPMKNPSNKQKNKLNMAEDKPVVIDSYNIHSNQLSDLDRGKSFNKHGIPCNHCNKLVPNKLVMSSHIFRVHNYLLPNACNLCGQNYATKQSASRHSRKHMQECHPCKQCGKQFCSIQMLRKHIITFHCNSKRKKCINQYKDTMKDPMEINQSDHHSSLKFLYCDICGLKYKFQSSLNRHNVIHHTNRSRAVKNTNDVEMPQVIDGSIDCETNEIQTKIQLNDHFSIIQNNYAVSCSNKVKIPTNINENSHQNNNKQVKCNNDLKKCTVSGPKKKLAMVQTKNFKPKISTYNNTVVTRLQKKMSVEPTQLVTNKTVMSSQQNPAQTNESKVDMRKCAVPCLTSKQIRMFIPKVRSNTVAVKLYTPNKPQTDRGSHFYVLLDKDSSSNCIMPYECDLCGVKQTDYLSGLQHANLHCQYQHQCKHCNKEFYSASLLLDHKKQNHPNSNQFQCGHCDKWHKTKQSLQEHIHLSHMAYPLAFQNKCLVCNESFVREHKINDHVWVSPDNIKIKC